MSRDTAKAAVDRTAGAKTGDRPLLLIAVVEGALILLLAVALLRGGESAAGERSREGAPKPVADAATDVRTAPAAVTAAVGADEATSSRDAADLTPSSAPQHDTFVLFGSVTDTKGAELRGGDCMVAVYVGDATKPLASTQLGRGDFDYAFPGLRAGPHRLNVSAEGYRDVDRSIVVPTERDRLRLDLRLEPAWRLKVLLVTPEGQPLSEALAALGKASTGFRRSAATALATVDPPPSPLPMTDLRESPIGMGKWSGNNEVFSRSNIALPKRYAGFLDLPEDRPMYVSAVLRCAVLATERVEPGQDEVRLVVATASLSAAFATVRVRIVDPEGAPIAGAKVSISDAQSGNAGTATDAEGRIEFRDLSPGLLMLGPGHGGGGGWSITPWQVVVAPGAVVDLGDLVAHQRVDCAVRFVGRPADAEVSVAITGPDAPPHALLRPWRQHYSSRKEDELKLSVTPGRYRLTARCATLIAQATVDTAVVGTAPLVVALQQGSNLRIVPSPQRRVEVELFDSAGASQWRRWITWSTPFDVPLLPGDYRAVLRALDGSSSECRLSLGAAGGELDLR